MKTFIIAEAGVNHNGSIELAKKLIDTAVYAGADAVKFQSFKAEKLVSRFAPKANYQLQTTQIDETQFDMLKNLELSHEEHKILFNHCMEKGITFLSTPFDEESLDFLVNELDISIIKLSSGEITNAPLLLRAAQTDKPIIISTGMSTLGEVEIALGVLAFGYTCKNIEPTATKFAQAYCSEAGQQAIRSKVQLLHCTTEYPCPYSEVNLAVIETMRLAFGLDIGFSDHTTGIVIPIAAVARGVRLIEKHFTLDKNFIGPDHKASLNPNELCEMIKSIRFVEMAIGNTVKVPTSSEIGNSRVARRSLCATSDIVKGELFNVNNLTVKRPGTGIEPMLYWDYFNKRADRDIKADELI